MPPKGLGKGGACPGVRVRGGRQVLFVELPADLGQGYNPAGFTPLTDHGRNGIGRDRRDCVRGVLPVHLASPPLSLAYAALRQKVPPA